MSSIDRLDVAGRIAPRASSPARAVVRDQRAAAFVAIDPQAVCEPVRCVVVVMRLFDQPAGRF